MHVAKGMIRSGSQVWVGFGIRILVDDPVVMGVGSLEDAVV